jgi:hypothetical protein
MRCSSAHERKATVGVPRQCWRRTYKTVSCPVVSVQRWVNRHRAFVPIQEGDSDSSDQKGQNTRIPMLSQSAPSSDGALSSGSAICSGSVGGPSAGWPTRISRRRCATRRCSRGRGHVSPRPPAVAAPPRSARRRSRGSSTPCAPNTRSQGSRRHAPLHDSAGRPSRAPAVAAGRGAPSSAAAHSASQRAHRLRPGRRDTGRWTADDGLGAHRVAGRRHRRGPQDRNTPAGRELAAKIAAVLAGGAARLAIYLFPLYSADSHACRSRFGPRSGWLSSSFRRKY